MSEDTPVVAAIRAVIERYGLQEELIGDTTSWRGWVTWSRIWEGKTRHIRFAPPDSPQTEYILSWFDDAHEGRWMGEVDHILEIFARFLIDGEDWRRISADNFVYLKRRRASNRQ